MMHGYCLGVIFTLKEIGVLHKMKMNKEKIKQFFLKLNQEPEMPEKKSISVFMKVLRVTGTVFTVLMGMLAVLLLSSVHWMLKTWSNLTMEELIFHLKSPLQGTNEGMIQEYIQSCVIITVVVTLILIALFIMFRKKRLAHHVTVLATLVVSFTTIFFSVRHVWNTLDVSTYSSNQSVYSTFIDDNYVDPKEVELSFPEQKRNLIYIFLESMETTYTNQENGGAFKDNVIPELAQISNTYENFSGDHKTLNGGISLNGTGWTVGAMFGQTSGLPLLIPIGKNDMNTQDHFFPGITALGDILQSAGYNQGLLIGSEAEFGGRDVYFTDHGEYDIWDYNYFSDNQILPEDYRVWWGYEDARLFEFAKDKLRELSSQDKPFNLTLLTVDTHFEDGYICSDCEEIYKDNQYANAMACSSKKVDAFLKWIQQQDFYENTTIVISGDHLTMDSDFCEDVDSDYQRRVYTAYINAAAEPEIETARSYSTFDNFPTTLASMGVKIDGDRLGLGTNLFSSRQTLVERFGVDTIDTELSKKSHLMEKLTSDIKENNLNITEQEAEEVIPPITAEITATPYDYHKGKYKVVIDNMVTGQEIQAVRCAVWASEDQSDLQWYEAKQQTDGSYIADVMARDFGYAAGEYNVHVYVVNSYGESEMIGAVMGAITK